MRTIRVRGRWWLAGCVAAALALPGQLHAQAAGPAGPAGTGTGTVDTVPPFRLTMPADQERIGSFHEARRDLRQREIANWLVAQQPGFDPDTPEGQQLLWYLASWAHPQPDGARAISATYFQEGVSNYNAVRQLLDTLAAQQRDPALIRAWSRVLSHHIIRLRLTSDVPRWRQLIQAMPEGGERVRPDTGAALMQWLRDHGPDQLQGPAALRWMQALADVNPALTPRYWYRYDAGELDEPDPHVVVRLEDGSTRVYRFVWTAGEPIWLPPRAWLRAQAAKDRDMPTMLMPTPEPDAAVRRQATCIELILHDPEREEGPLTIRLIVDRERLISGYTLMNRRVGRVTSVPPPPPQPPKPREKGLEDIDIEDFVNPQTELPRELVERHSAPPPRPRFDPLVYADGRLTGSFWISGRDADPGQEYVYTLDIKPAGDRWDGSLRVDRLRGARSTYRSGRVEGRVIEPGRTDAFAADWPQWQGPHGTGAGIAGDAPVGGWDSAKLAWVSQDTIPTGRGPDTRGRPRNAHGRTLMGGWASPMLADNRVVLSYYQPGGDRYGWGAKEVFTKSGEDPHDYRLNLIRADDVVEAFDATTGRKLWSRVYVESGVNWAGFNKSGPMLSPAIHDGVIYTIGTLGHVYALDLKDGRTRWISDIGDRATIQQGLRDMLEANGRMFGSRSDFASNVAFADGVVLVNDHLRHKAVDKYRYETYNGLTGLCARTGRTLWHRPEVMANGSSHGVPLIFQHEGGTYLIAFGQSTLYCIEPRTGRILWTQSGALGTNDALAIHGNILVAHAAPNLDASSPQPAENTEAEVEAFDEDDDESDSDAGDTGDEIIRPLAAWRVTPEGATPLWVQRQFGSFTSGIVIHHDRVYAVARQPQRMLICLDLNTGAVLGTAAQHAGASVPLGNQGSLVAMGPWIIGLGGNRGFRLHPADPAKLGDVTEVPVPLAAGYIGAMYPIVADGRMILRGHNRLLCYDLRQRP